MLHRPFAAFAVAAALAFAGCGGGGEPDGRQGESAAAEPAEHASVLVTRDCGREVVVPKESVPAGLTAMQALRRVADVEASTGGKFVTAINGASQNEKKKLAWLFYVNGKMAQKGASEITLGPGDVEWWDLHDWTRKCAVPASAR